MEAVGKLLYESTNRSPLGYRLVLHVHTYIHGCCAKTMCSKHYSTYILGELRGEKEFVDTAEFVTVASESFVSCYIMDSKKTIAGRDGVEFCSI